MPSRRLPYPFFLLAITLCIPPGLNLFQYWLHNPLYGFGIWVPFLAGYLFWNRLEHIRLANQPLNTALPTTIIGLYLLSLPFLRVIQIANPDWRLLDWILSLGAFISLLALFYRTGGRELLAAFWFPAAFLLTAVPWSTSAEQAFISNAIPLTGRIASELLWMVGIGAVDSGKTLYTSVGPILISEDCSGIRSVHLAIMAACFWIGYFHLTKGKAIWMGIAAVGITLALNILRVVVLVGLVVKSNQMAMMDRWHDTMGSVAQVLLVLALPAVAWVLRSDARRRPILNQSLAWRAPLWVPAAILIWELGAAASAEIWYRIHERPAQLSSEYWGINLKPTGFTPQDSPIAPSVRENYFYSEGHNLTWRDASSALWTFLYMDFDQGALSACTHNIHRPEVCLAMADFTLVAVPAPLKVLISGHEVTMAHKIFQRGNRPVHLFHTYFQNTQDEDSRTDWTYQGRLRAALMAIRSHRAELVYFMVEAPYSPDQAKEAASRYLSQLLVRKAN